jgi:hypothetical protein
VGFSGVLCGFAIPKNSFCTHKKKMDKKQNPNSATSNNNLTQKQNETQSSSLPRITGNKIIRFWNFYNLYNDVATSPNRILQEKVDQPNLTWKRKLQNTQTGGERALDEAKLFADQSLKKTKDTVNNTMESTKQILGEQTENFNTKLQETKAELEEKPQQIISSLKSTRDALALETMANMKKARNLFICIFVGGCFAAGLGFGLGMSGGRPSSTLTQAQQKRKQIYMQTINRKDIGNDDPE